MSDIVNICIPFAPTADDGSARAFDPAWRSETVLALARAIEAEKAFDRMPILADALQDAGCEDVVLLRHCRECEQHEEWCWVLRQVIHPTEADDRGSRTLFGNLPRYNQPPWIGPISPRRFGSTVMSWVLIYGMIFVAVLFVAVFLHGLAGSSDTPTTKTPPLPPTSPARQ
jgi:hypothetical protein